MTSPFRSLTVWLLCLSLVSSGLVDASPWVSSPRPAIAAAEMSWQALCQPSAKRQFSRLLGTLGALPLPAIPRLRGLRPLAIGIAFPAMAQGFDFQAGAQRTWFSFVKDVRAAYRANLPSGLESSAFKGDLISAVHNTWAQVPSLSSRPLGLVHPHESISLDALNIAEPVRYALEGRIDLWAAHSRFLKDATEKVFRTDVVVSDLWMPNVVRVDWWPGNATFGFPPMTDLWPAIQVGIWTTAILISLAAIVFLVGEWRDRVRRRDSQQEMDGTRRQHQLHGILLTFASFVGSMPLPALRASLDDILRYESEIRSSAKPDPHLITEVQRIKNLYQKRVVILTARNQASPSGSNPGAAVSNGNHKNLHAAA